MLQKTCSQVAPHRSDETIMSFLCLQDLKHKILVKGQKDHLVERYSSDCSSSDDEAGCSEGKPSVKKQDRKVTNPPLPENAIYEEI